jgi:hypothetical protein
MFHPRGFPLVIAPIFCITYETEPDFRFLVLFSFEGIGLVRPPHLHRFAQIDEIVSIPDASASHFSRLFDGYLDLHLHITIRWIDIVPKVI